MKKPIKLGLPPDSKIRSSKKISVANDLQIIESKRYKEAANYFWRYMDIHKFLDFLNTTELSLTRMDLFEDPLEGIPLKTLIQFSKDADRDLLTDHKLSEIIINQKLLDECSQELRQQIELVTAIQKSSYVSCWFCSDTESMAMWNLYSNPDSLAVRFKRNILIDLTKSAYNKARLQNLTIRSGYCGIVEYQKFDSINYHPNTNDFKVAKVVFRKEKSYEHENEFRIIVRIQKTDSPPSQIRLNFESLDHIGIKFYTHPKMKAWKKANIKRELDRFALCRKLSDSMITLRNT
ncbi:MAG: hypothetical protein RDU14_03060 [Melioribacteraceae bacterium]|nr:hypothetical protein [Melioribacteraceae bacterium]